MILYINLPLAKIKQTKSKQTKLDYKNHCLIGPACAKVRKQRTAKVLLAKVLVQGGGGRFVKLC